MLLRVLRGPLFNVITRKRVQASSFAVKGLVRGQEVKGPKGGEGGKPIKQEAVESPGPSISHALR